MNKNELVKKLQISYKKIKSHVYFDKTLALLRRQLVDFEYQIINSESGSDIDNKINKIADKILTNDSNEWEEYIKDVLDSIKVECFPKAIKPAYEIKKDIGIDVIINNSSEMNREIDVEKIQTVINMNVEGHILGTLWVLLIGSKLDKNFSKNSYGNRILHNVEEGVEEFSPYLYKPYFNEYKSWRDNGLKIAEECYDSQRDCIIIMADIERFYYSVNFTKKIFESFISEENLILNRINNFVFNVLKIYSNLVNTRIEVYYKNIFLPIGFMPSAILANWYLDNFDKNIINRCNPTYYGRYADDIVLVEKVDKNSKVHNIIKDGKIDANKIISYYFIDQKVTLFRGCRKIVKCPKYISCKIRKIKKKVLKEYYINFTDKYHTNARIRIQKNKFKLFYLKSSGSKAILECFRKTIRENSSEFRLLPEGDIIGERRIEEIYKMDSSDSINKFSAINKIKINRFELSKFIGKYLTISKAVNLEKNDKIFEILKKVYDCNTIIENYITWESLLTLCIVNKNIKMYDYFVNKIYNSINMVKEPYDNSGAYRVMNIKKTLHSYLESCIFRTSALVWGNDIDSIFDKFNKNKIVNKLFNYEIRMNFCKSRMVNKLMCSVLIDIFINNNINNFKLKNSNDMIYLSDFNSCINLLLNTKGKVTIQELFINSLTKKLLYKYYPYYITMQDLSKTLFVQKVISKKNIQEKEIDDFNSKVIEKLYYSLNYNIDYKFCENFNVDAIMFGKDFGDKIPVNNKKENINIIKIESSDKKQKTQLRVAIATAQNNKENFKSVLLDEPKRNIERYINLQEIINQSVKNNVDILVLPENYLPFEWLYLLEREAKKNGMAIITGIEHIKIHNEVYNLIASIFPFETYNFTNVYTNIRSKVFFSPEERRKIEGYRCVPKEGNDYYMFVWKNIWIPIYCCFEIASINDRSTYFNFADLFIVVEWNSDTRYFANIIESMCRDMHCYCIQVNSADYGDSCLIRPSKSSEQTILRTKGGKNSSILVEDIDINKLRLFQIKEYELQKDDRSFKPTPPNFNKEIPFLKYKNKLFEKLFQID